MEVSRAVEDYLKTLHRLGGADRLVSPVEIAARLNIRSPSVTAMLKRLGEAGLIQYAPGKGAQLSPEGLRAARRVIRRHRLVELFLHQVLKLDWSEVDNEAEALEHAISPRLEQAIADFLGQPMEDPHGHPIPTDAGHLQWRDLRPVVAFHPGDHFIIREVPDDEPQRLKRWQELGILPGTPAKVLDHHPLDQVFELEIAGRKVSLGQDSLTGILGEVAESPALASRTGETRDEQSA